MRIVSLSRAAEEWLDAFRSDLTIVGRTQRPPGESAAEVIPVTKPVSQEAFDAAPEDPFMVTDDVDVHAVAGLSPDVVITASRRQSHAVRQAGIAAEVILFAPTSFRAMLTSALELGHRLGAGRGAMAAIADRESVLASRRARAGVSKRHGFGRSVLIATSLQPVICGGYWCAELVELAGAEPAFSEAGEPPRIVPDEEVSGRVPDHVVMTPAPFGSAGTEDGDPPAIPHVARRAPLPAPIEGSTLHILPSERTLFHAGPGLYDTVQWLIETLSAAAARDAAIRLRTS